MSTAFTEVRPPLSIKVVLDSEKLIVYRYRLERQDTTDATSAKALVQSQFVIWSVKIYTRLAAIGGLCCGYAGVLIYNCGQVGQRRNYCCRQGPRKSVENENVEVIWNSIVVQQCSLMRFATMTNPFVRSFVRSLHEY